MDIEQLRKLIEDIVGEKIDWSSPVSVANALQILKKKLDNQSYEERQSRPLTADDTSKVYKKFFECISGKDRNDEKFIVTMLKFFYDRKGGAFFYDLIQAHADRRLLEKVAYLHKVQVTIKEVPLLPPAMKKTLQGKTEKRKKEYIQNLADFQKARREAFEQSRSNEPQRDFK